MYNDRQDALIELGAVTAETRGGPIGFEDSERTLQVAVGLIDD
jgi:hypothetical protein